MSAQHTDLLIVGAGPAGMAAAVTARRHGLTVRVLDVYSDARYHTLFRNVAVRNVDIWLGG